MLLTQLDLWLEQNLPRSVYDLPSQIIGTVFGYYNYFSQFLAFLPFFKEAEASLLAMLQSMPFIGAFFIPKPIAPPPPTGAMELVLRRVDRVTGSRARTSFVAGMGFAGVSAGLYYSGKNLHALRKQNNKRRTHSRRSLLDQDDLLPRTERRKRDTIPRPRSPSSGIVSSVPSSAFDDASNSEEDYNNNNDSLIWHSGSWDLLMPSHYNEDTNDANDANTTNNTNDTTRTTRTRTRTRTRTTTTDPEPLSDTPINNFTTNCRLPDSLIPPDADTTDADTMPPTDPFKFDFSMPKFWWTSYLV